MDMAADGASKVITTQYLQTTKDAIGGRSLKGAITKLDAEYPKPSHGKQIEKINDLTNFSRRKYEEFRPFWIRYD